MSGLTAKDKEILCSLDHHEEELKASEQVEKNAKKASSYYNALRLMVINIDTILDGFKHSFLPKMFAVAGFFYGIEVIFDVLMIAYEVFHKDENNKDISYWQRLKNAITADRISHLVNAALWVSINVAAFIVTGGISAVLTVAGFVFDLGHAIVRSAMDYFDNDHAAKSVDAKIAKTKYYIDKLEKLNKKTRPENQNHDHDLLDNKINDLDIKIKDLEIKVKDDKNPTESAELKAKIVNLKYYKLKLEKLNKKTNPEEQNLFDDKIAHLDRKVKYYEHKKVEIAKRGDDIVKKNIKSIVTAGLLLVGIAMVLFPPTTIAGAFFIGASILLGINAFLLGSKIRNDVSNLTKQKVEQEAEVQETEVKEKTYNPHKCQHLINKKPTPSNDLVKHDVIKIDPNIVKPNTNAIVKPDTNAVVKPNLDVVKLDPIEQDKKIIIAEQNVPQKVDSDFLRPTRKPYVADFSILNHDKNEKGNVKVKQQVARYQDEDDTLTPLLERNTENVRLLQVTG